MYTSNISTCTQMNKQSANQDAWPRRIFICPISVLNKPLHAANQFYGHAVKMTPAGVPCRSRVKKQQQTNKQKTQTKQTKTSQSILVEHGELWYDKRICFYTHVCACTRSLWTLKNVNDIIFTERTGHIALQMSSHQHDCCIRNGQHHLSCFWWNAKEKQGSLNIFFCSFKFATSSIYHKHIIAHIVLEEKETRVKPVGIKKKRKILVPLILNRIRSVRHI